MPSLPGCCVCPFRDDPALPSAGLITGHARYCQLLDARHPDYDPAVLPVYRRITADLNGVPPPPMTEREIIERRRAGKVRLKLGERLPRKSKDG
jgi:hypothetical protein